MTFTDAYDKVDVVHILTDKSGRSQLIALKEFVAIFRNMHEGRCFKRLHMDNERGFNKDCKTFLADLGIQYTTTETDTPEQIGQAEKHQADLNRIIATLLRKAKLPAKYWPFALLHAVWLKNRRPHPALNGKTPLEVSTGKPPRLYFVRVWGSKVYYKNKTLAKSDKFTPKGKKGILMGYTGDSPQAIIFDESDKKIHKTSSYTVIEPASQYEQPEKATIFAEGDDVDALIYSPAQPVSIHATAPPRHTKTPEENETPEAHSETSVSPMNEHEESTTPGQDRFPTESPTSQISGEYDESRHPPLTPGAGSPITASSTVGLSDPQAIATRLDKGRLQVPPTYNLRKYPQPTLEHQKLADQSSQETLEQFKGTLGLNSANDGQPGKMPSLPGSVRRTAGSPILLDAQNPNSGVSYIPEAPSAASTTTRKSTRKGRGEHSARFSHEDYTKQTSRNAHLARAFIATCNSATLVARPYLDDDVESVFKSTVLGMAAQMDQENLDTVDEGHDFYEHIFVHSCYALNAYSDLPEPKSFKEAKASPEWNEWHAGMREEYESMGQRDVWKKVRVEDLPTGTKVLAGKWVYKKKRHADNSIYRYKARWVARGFLQRFGLDYDETYAAVAHIVTIRLCLALAAQYDHDVRQMDVDTAYLYAKLDKPIYMQLPHGFEEEGYVCQLFKAIYGLKQSGRLWWETLTETLEKLGFKSSAMDPCMLIQGTITDGVIVLVYSDDILIIGPHEKAIAVETMLASEFSCKIQGEAKYYLGMEITRDRKAGTLFLSQAGYIDRMLAGVGFQPLQGKPVKTPYSSEKYLEKNTEHATKEDVHTFLAQLGSVLWNSSKTRPDTGYVASTLGQFAANPSKAHLHEIKHAYRYLRSTKDMALVFRRLPGDVTIAGFADANYGREEGRRSGTGYGFMINGTFFSWAARLQQLVVTSTAEAEYVAVATAAKEAMFIRTLCTELGIPGIRAIPLTLRSDNEAAITIANGKGFTPRTKHFDIRYHFIRDVITRGLIQVKHIPTGDNVADALTKPLPLATFHKFRAMMGLMPLPVKQ
jgi:hypothetical protein